MKIIKIKNYKKIKKKISWYGYSYDMHHECVMVTYMGIRK